MLLKDFYEVMLFVMLVINEVDCVVDGDFVYFEMFLVSYYLFFGMFDVWCFLLCIVYLDLLLCW